jgi:S1-C subfamily serine protease
LLPDDILAADRQKMKEISVSDGDGVFILGFPAVVSAGQRNYAVARHGIISRIGEALEGREPTYLLDSFVFPGNSGGPVILEPNIIGITNTKTNTKAYLIGVVRAYLPYQDTAVSQQTGGRRVIFEEITGLTETIPIDYVDGAIWKYLFGTNGLPPAPP